MDVVLDGVRYQLSDDAVHAAVQGHRPDGVRVHWVDVDGTRWPPRQVLALAAGLDRTDVTSSRALRLMERLGFPTSRVPQPDRAAVPIPDVAPLLEPTTAVAPAAFLAAGRTAADEPGLYSWWTDVEGAHDLSAGLGHPVEPGLVYAGRAGGIRPSGVWSTNTLWGRVATMHLGGRRGFSTFRVTLTACLSAEGAPVVEEAWLTRWMHRHLRVAVLPLPAEAVAAGEERLLALADPPLNLRDVPRTDLRRALTHRRRAVSRA
jgi:hypothetical protein